MTGKLDQFEIQREISLMLDSFEKPVQREIMAGLAERCGMKLSDKPAGGGNTPRPGYNRKRRYG